MKLNRKELVDWLLTIAGGIVGGLFGWGVDRAVQLPHAASMLLAPVCGALCGLAARRMLPRSGPRKSV